MEQPSSYQKIIYKPENPQASQELAKTLRPHSNSPQTYKQWTPSKFEQERMQLKKDREEKYIQSLPEDQKPVLVVKQKHIYKDTGIVAQSCKNIQNKYKIMKDTKIADDQDVQMKLGMLQGQRDTVIHEGLGAEEAQIAQEVQRIQGIEFLPEGFLELEPILPKDAYQFTSDIDETRFAEEQRRAVAKRRKQYEERGVVRQRDVSIYVIGEYKNDLQSFLEEFYTENKRKLKDEELVFAANALNVDKQKIQQLEEAFLQRKRLLNNRRISTFITRKQPLPKNLQALPDDLKRLLVKFQGQTKVEGKVNRLAQEQTQGFLKKYDDRLYKQHKQRRIVPRNKTADKTVKTVRQNDFQQLASKFDKLISQKEKKEGPQEQEAQPEQPVQTAQPTLYSYFDQEISRILDDIKGCDASKRPVTQVDVEHSLQWQEEQKLQQLFMKSSPMPSSKESKSKDEKPQEGDLFGKSEPFTPQASDSSEQLQVIAQQQRKQGEQQNTTEQKEVQQRLPEQNLRYTLGQNTEETLAQAQIFEFFNTEDKVTQPLQAIRTVTVLKDNEGNVNIEQKLQPLAVEGQYVFAQISATATPGRDKEQRLSLRDEKGKELLKKNFSVDASLFTGCLLTNIQNNSHTLFIKNEHGQTVVKAPIDLLKESGTDQAKDILNEQGQRKGRMTVTKQGSTVVTEYKLTPLLIADKYYIHTVKETYEGDESIGLQIVTTAETGEVITETEVELQRIGGPYTVDIQIDKLDANGNRENVVVVKNGRDEVITRQVFNEQLRETLKDCGVKEYAQEVECENGMRQLLTVQLDTEGNVASSKEIRTANLADNCYIDVSEEELRNGIREARLSLKNFEDLSLLEERCKTLAGSVHINKSLQQFFLKAMNNSMIHMGTDKQQLETRLWQPSLDFEFQEVYGPDGKQKLTVRAKNRGGQIIAEQSIENETSSDISTQEKLDDALNQLQEMVKRDKLESVKMRSESLRQKASTILKNKDLQSIGAIEELPVSAQPSKLLIDRLASQNDDKLNKNESLSVDAKHTNNVAIQQTHKGQLQVLDKLSDKGSFKTSDLSLLPSITAILNKYYEESLKQGSNISALRITDVLLKYYQEALQERIGSEKMTGLSEIISQYYNEVIKQAPTSERLSRVTNILNNFYSEFFNKELIQKSSKVPSILSSYYQGLLFSALKDTQQAKGTDLSESQKQQLMNAIFDYQGSLKTTNLLSEYYNNAISVDKTQLKNKLSTTKHINLLLKRASSSYLSKQRSQCLPQVEQQYFVNLKDKSASVDVGPSKVQDSKGKDESGMSLGLANQNGFRGNNNQLLEFQNYKRSPISEQGKYIDSQSKYSLQNQEQVWQCGDGAFKKQKDIKEVEAIQQKQDEKPQLQSTQQKDIEMVVGKQESAKTDIVDKYDKDKLASKPQSCVQENTSPQVELPTKSAFTSVGEQQQYGQGFRNLQDIGSNFYILNDSQLEQLDPIQQLQVLQMHRDLCIFKPTNIVRLTQTENKEGVPSFHSSIKSNAQQVKDNSQSYDNQPIPVHDVECKSQSLVKRVITIETQTPVSQIAKSSSIKKFEFNKKDEPIKEERAIADEGNAKEVENKEMIKMIEQVVKAERESIKILKKGSIKEDTNDMIKEFYEFCQKRLPNDQTYKESVLFVSLFYFFLENKHLVK